MRQGCQNLRASQKESHTQNKQMSPIGYSSDMEEIVNASWSTFQHDGVAAFNILERSPLPQVFLQRILLENDLKYHMAANPGELTVILQKEMRIVHMKAFPTPRIGLTGMETLIIHMRATMAGSHMMSTM